MTTEYQVGQRVWVYSVNSRGRGPQEATVTKVGRKLVTTDRGWYGHSPGTFRMETGHSNDAYGHEHIKSDAEKAAAERSQISFDYLHSKRIHDLPQQLSIEAVEQIVAIIRADLGDPE